MILVPNLSLMYSTQSDMGGRRPQSKDLTDCCIPHTAGVKYIRHYCIESFQFKSLGLVVVAVMTPPPSSSQHVGVHAIKHLVNTWPSVVWPV